MIVLVGIGVLYPLALILFDGGIIPKKYTTAVVAVTLILETAWIISLNYFIN